MISWSTSNIKLIFAEKPCELCKNFDLCELKSILSQISITALSSISPLGMIQLIWNYSMTTLFYSKEIDQAQHL
jgi:hypothetical protein